MISQAGGTPTAITAVDISRGELFHAQPSFLPDGTHFLYFRSGTPEVEGVYAGSLDSSPGEQSEARILTGSFAASYANGYFFFLRENTLMAQPFDAGRLRLRAEPIPMAAGVATTWYNVGIFSISPSGTLAYRARPRTGRVQLTWLDRQGKTLGTFGQSGADWGLSLSPDGTRGLVIDSPNGPGDLWTLDFARGLHTRLTFGARTHLTFGPPGVWSPDGSRLAFAAGPLLDEIYEKASSGAGEEKELFRVPNRTQFPTSWSRDGRFLLYVTLDRPKTGDDVWVLPHQGDRKPTLLLGTVYNEWAATFSPDMRWIAYNSNETGRAEVFVCPFLAVGPSGAPSLGEGKWQVSEDGGRFPKWRADGKEIFFENYPVGTGKMAVEVTTSGGAFEYGTPHPLFQDPGQLPNFWDVAPGRETLSGWHGSPADRPSPNYGGAELGAESEKVNASVTQVLCSRRRTAASGDAPIVARGSGMDRRLLGHDPERLDLVKFARHTQAGPTTFIVDTRRGRYSQARYWHEEACATVRVTNEPPIQNVHLNRHELRIY